MSRRLCLRGGLRRPPGGSGRRPWAPLAAAGEPARAVPYLEMAGDTPLRFSPTRRPSRRTIRPWSRSAPGRSRRPRWTWPRCAVRAKLAEVYWQAAREVKRERSWTRRSVWSARRVLWKPPDFTTSPAGSRSPLRDSEAALAASDAGEGGCSVEHPDDSASSRPSGSTSR